MKAILRLFLVANLMAVFTFTTMACGGKEKKDTPQIVPTWTFSISGVNSEVDKTVTFSTTIAATFSLNGNCGTLTVNNDARRGSLKLTRSGSCELQATALGATKTHVLNVVENPKIIILSELPDEMYIGQSANLTYILTGVNSDNRNLVWSVSPVDAGTLETVSGAHDVVKFNALAIADQSTISVSLNGNHLAELTTKVGDEPDFESVKLYTAGSNQEWALSALSELDNSSEKIRLYNYLLRAHTYLLLYDKQDYTDQYNFWKNQWQNALPDFDEEIQANLRQMLDDENWTIDIVYPLENPFKLSLEEFLQVYFYFTDANPQFFLGRIVASFTLNSNSELLPAITVPAYYAFVVRRQETFNNILYAFDYFKWQLTNSIDISNQYNVVKYVYDHLVETLEYNFAFADYQYLSRERADKDTTILGYFGDSKLTICKGYATTMMYLLNRLGIPAIDQGGGIIYRNNDGAIIDYVLHAWNIVKLNSKWYFLDATWESKGQYNYFLKGRGKNNDSDFLYLHSIAKDMVYPEVDTDDY